MSTSAQQIHEEEVDPLWKDIAKEFGAYSTGKELRRMGLTKHWLDDEYWLDKWPTPEKLIISTAAVGNFVDPDMNPNQPFKVEEVLRQYKECIKLGSAAVHYHARGENGERYDFDSVEKALPLYKKVIGEIRSYAPDIVSEGGAGWYYGKKLEDSIQTLQTGLFDVAYVHPFPGHMGDGIRFYEVKFDPMAVSKYCEKKGIKPCIDIHDTNNVLNAKKWLIDTKILSKPTYWHILGPGPGGFIHMPNAKSMAQGLIYLVDLIKSIDEEAVIQVSMCGRPTYYIVVLSIMLGLHVRVGMEDTIWKYPHEDEKLVDNVEVVRKTVEVANVMGRKIATSDDYRKIIGI
jgi:3-keto-5-aminohexanoate cleavage enzyme